MLEERQENLEEIKKAVAKNIKKEKNYTDAEINKMLEEANENVEFLKALNEITVPTEGKKVIFVDGKACLVYDSGVFYIEDSTDSKKQKKKLTRQQATELYVEYFFRYIMNPALEKKKMLENVKKISVKTKPEKLKKNVPSKEKTKEEVVQIEQPKETVKAKVTKKEDLVR